MTKIDTIESNAFRPEKLDLTQKLLSLNKFFVTNLSPENGIYGIAEQVRDDGILIRTGFNETGHRVRDYIKDGQLFQRREVLGNGCNATTLFDDNGTAYLRTVKKLADNHVSEISSTLTPNIIIKKGNFTSVIDAYGRPVLNKIEDLQTKDGARNSLSSISREYFYLENDQKGHLIADSLGGPATRENIVPQLDKVNLKKMKRVENIVRDLKSAGHTVDYEIHTNYVGSDQRPSSFEPKIIVDGHEYTIPSELKKIYNDSSESTIRHITTTMGEKFALSHEIGIQSGLVGAGITFAVSTVDNVSSFLDGKITADDMIYGIVEDTALSGAIGYGTAFISSAASQALSKSSTALISKIGGTCAPAAVVSFAVESYENISDYAQGVIDGSELAYELGENAAGIAGSFAGGALTGAALGTVAGPVGTVAGAVVGGVIGCVIATEAYHTAVELGAQGAELLAEKAGQFAGITIDTVAEVLPEQLGTVKEAFRSFAHNAEVVLPV